MLEISHVVFIFRIRLLSWPTCSLKIARSGLRLNHETWTIPPRKSRQLSFHGTLCSITA